MKKRVIFFTILLLSAAFSFAQNSSFVSNEGGSGPVFVEEGGRRGRNATIGNRYIFIEGTADKREHLEFFMTNFVIEAGGAGYIVTQSRNEAAHTLRFNVAPNTMDTGGEEEQSNQYVIRLSLIRNTDDFEVLAYDFAFNDLEEMYAYNWMLFQNAAIYIPVFSEQDLILARELATRWKNKWIYIRASFDYPITLYLLQGDGLIGGMGLYSGTYDKPTGISPIDNEIMAMPGLTVGFEFQFLDFMSLEINYQISLGDTRNNTFLNMSAGAELKFPVKFENIVLTPYAASTFSFNPSLVFSDFPPLSVGAGVQLSAKGGTRGAFFVDIKYMFSFTDAVMHNPYLSYDQQLYPEPAVIHYKRSIIGIGIGYKIGFFDRIRR